MFLRLEDWHFGDGRGFANPTGDEEGECPRRCGLCGWHTSHTSLANVDLTSRCNLSCPVCFADANREFSDLPFESALAVERELQQLLFQGEDAKEGLAAYIEKRKPNFTAK